VGWGAGRRGWGEAGDEREGEVGPTRTQLGAQISWRADAEAAEAVVLERTKRLNLSLWSHTSPDWMLLDDSWGFHKLLCESSGWRIR